MERWEAIEDAYHIAHDLGDEARTRFLQERCGSDAAMRRQIEVLLAQDKSLSNFLDPPAVNLAADARLRFGNAADLTGLRVGPYEVLELIGSGGMGDVYRARDTRLGRDVALKTLPPHSAIESDRLARFEREAQVLASLNHPNIAAIYGLEELTPSAGPGQAVVRAIALELVEGPTLAERIMQGPIPVDEAVSIARQIAEALAAAHERAIVHRDLKPANIKVRPDGLVKVLDFGLAKALEPVSDGSVAPASPAITEIGVVLGTAAYMSPEQAKGRTADTRSDLWAFGCVLYEMLTGARAFPGEDVSDTLAAVLRHEPDLTRLPAAVPPSIRTLIEGCLQKDRGQCVADTFAARFLLSEPQSIAVTTSIPARQAWWKRAAPFVTTAVVAAAFTGIVAWGVQRSTSSGATNAHAVRFLVGAPRGTSFGTRENPSIPRISPNGTLLVFRVLRQGEPVLAVQPLDAIEARVLPGTEGARSAFWSADSRAIAFFSGEKLRTIGADGGPVQTICEAAEGFGGTWNRQGLIVFGGTQGLFQVAATGGQPTPLTTLQKNETRHRSPQFLPDGRRFLYFAPPNTVYLGSLDGRPPVRVLTTDLGALYASPGYLVFMREPGGALFAQRFDTGGGQARLVGDPVQIAESVLGLGENISISDDGVLAYAMNRPIHVSLAWVDRAGRSIQSVGPFPFEHYAAPRLSPDGKQLAVESVPAPLTQAAPWANQDVWVVDLEHGRPTQLTFDPASDEHPIWSPDSARIAFSRIQGANGLYEKLVTGEKPEERLLQPEAVAIAWDWTAQGIVYATGSGPDLWLLPLVGDRKPSMLMPRASQGRVSRDGRWLAYMSDELGRPEVFVTSFPPTGGKWKVSIDGGSLPMWRSNGKELFYLAPDGRLMAVQFAIDGSAFRPTERQALFQTALSGFYPRLRTYSVSPDGERFLMTLPEEPNMTPSIVVVSNWLAAISAR
jgi:serine/threonine protein kinase